MKLARSGRKSAAQTPAPKSERIRGSVKNPAGTASSAKSGAKIKFSPEVLKALTKKKDEYNQSHGSKVTLAALKAVYRRGAGAYSSSHRPTITGGAPNSRNAWAMARVNKFLLKKSGKPVKKAYVQDDDLMADGGQTETLLAPNGNRSNLTPEQYRLVRTPEFKAWFGDWENDPEKASKVVDGNGEPLVVYHGAKKKFYVFEERERNEGRRKTSVKGFYFTTNEWVAQNYAGGKGYVYSYFLNIKNYPHTTDKLVSEYSDIDDFLFDYGTTIQRFGYDGAKDTQGDFIVFNSNQIKLADGSNTTFDGTNPDIRFADGGQTGDINATNYFNSTKADFNGVEISDAEEILEAYKDYRRRKKKSEFINSSKYGNLRVDYESEKKNAYFERRSLSYYFVTEDNNSVIRISDHWSKSNYDDSKKLNCGNIRSCFWATDGNRFRYDIPGQKHTSILIAGICSFNQFTIVPKITFEHGGFLSQNVVCHHCGWRWNTNDSNPHDKYVCHNCGTDNSWYYGNNKMAKGGETSHAELKSVENFITETINNKNMPDNSFAKGGEMHDCGCGKAEDGMEVSTAKELPVGKLAKGMTLEQIARMHRYSPILLRKNLKAGIKTEMEHTDDPEIAEAIALDHLYEDPEYYRKLKMVEKFEFGSEGWRQATMAMGGVPDHEAIEISQYIFDQREKASRVVFSDDPKISRFMICLKLYDAAKMHENSADDVLEKNMWNEISHIWKKAMNEVKNGSNSMHKVQEILSLSNIFVYGNGGLAYGNSHAKGGMPLLNKSTNSIVEIEGGEGVVKKDSMLLKEKMEFEGEKLTACEIVSKINERTGGVKFKCSDVKRIIQNDGKFA